MDSGVAGEKNILAPSSQGASDNIQPGDIVLLKQNQTPRNGWTMTSHLSKQQQESQKGRIKDIIPGSLKDLLPFHFRCCYALRN